MSLHQEDARGKKIIFVANCLLNANNKVREFARYPGMFSEIVRLLDDFSIGVIQMPCPETLYMGNQRWWHSRNLYDNVGYRRFCRQLAGQMADYLQNYQNVNYEVVAVLTCDGSPSCGSSLSSYCEDWGGRPKEVPRTLVNKPGIFIEELTAEVADRRLTLPFIYGLAMDDRERSNEQIIKEFREFIDSKLAQVTGGAG
ncbi:CD3072 family TudS-related putative desulfidase [Sporomusa sp. KB1]|jgi:predicted secreted protein|uniref:CD3072 family TudS-related putative desulfidase n=1 Tax=Sporomusa sp. KB1 TaxID=943346 RepID=UPI0011AB0D6F|nr:CD3072 family TudS-related putative desulfidase [Sporomusa sp. KB1]TWH47918.1 putative secreted protein [Sporomusa sp. KB1]